MSFSSEYRNSVMILVKRKVFQNVHIHTLIHDA